MISSMSCDRGSNVEVTKICENNMSTSENGTGLDTKKEWVMKYLLSCELNMLSMENLLTDLLTSRGLNKSEEFQLVGVWRVGIDSIEGKCWLDEV